jgi:hypothetical protein
MPYNFTPPKVPHGTIGIERLFQFYEAEVGVDVLKFGNEYIEVLYPNEDDISLADKVYRAGAISVVSDEEAAQLIEAGYEDYLTEIE